MSVEEILAAVEALPEPERERIVAELVRRSEGWGSKPFRSAHEKANHLIGRGSGLGDLSVNKAYLRDLGGNSL